MMRYGRLASLLFVAGAIMTLPSAFLLDPVPGFEIVFITGLALVSGAVCWVLPWDRLPGWALDTLCTVGTLEIALVCGIVDGDYRVLYFVVVAFAAFALPSRARVAAQLALIVVALAQPLEADPFGRESVRIALLWAPVAIIVATAVRFLRETLERREQASRAFAREAIELAIRLRRGTSGREDERAAELADLERAVERLR